MRARPIIAALGASVLVLTLAPATSAHASHRSPLTIEVLSTAPDQVTGGDALVRVSAGAPGPAG